MAEDLLRSKHAFGSEDGIDQAISDKKIDAYDILFLDSSTDPKIGWIDKNGNKVIVRDKKQIVPVEELPTTAVDPEVLYIYQGEGYVWSEADGKCVSISKPADLSGLETEISKKVDEETVDLKIANALDSLSVEVVEF